MATLKSSFEFWLFFLQIVTLWLREIIVNSEIRRKMTFSRGLNPLPYMEMWNLRMFVLSQMSVISLGGERNKKDENISWQQQHWKPQVRPEVVEVFPWGEWVWRLWRLHWFSTEAPRSPPKEHKAAWQRTTSKPYRPNLNSGLFSHIGILAWARTV